MHTTSNVNGEQESKQVEIKEAQKNESNVKSVDFCNTLNEPNIVHVIENIIQVC